MIGSLNPPHPKALKWWDILEFIVGSLAPDGDTASLTRTAQNRGRAGTSVEHAPHSKKASKVIA